MSSSNPPPPFKKAEHFHKPLFPSPLIFKLLNHNNDRTDHPLKIPDLPLSLVGELVDLVVMEVVKRGGTEAEVDIGRFDDDDDEEEKEDSDGGKRKSSEVSPAQMKKKPKVIVIKPCHIHTVAAGVLLDFS